MRALTPSERTILERAVAHETWETTEQEWDVVLDLHRRGLLGRHFYRRDGYEEPWIVFPAIPETSLALRVDAAYRATMGV